MRSPVAETGGVPSIVADIVERSFKCVLSFDRSQRIVCFNEAAEQTFGYSEKEVVGQPLGKLLPLPKRVNHDEMIDRIFEELLAQEAGEYRACIPCLRKNGEYFKANLVATLSRTPSEPLLIAVIEDIEEKQRRLRELGEVYELNRSLARRLLVQEEARHNALARELHDEMGQLATSLSIDLQLLKADLDPVDEMPRVIRAERMLRVVRDLHERIRDCVQELRPDVLDGVSLREAVSACAHRLGLERVGIRLRIDVEPGVEEGLRDLTRVHLFRFIQEALTNIARHSRASEAVVRVQRGLPRGELLAALHQCCRDFIQRSPERIVSLAISDNGTGFDPASVDRTSSGLRNLRERVTAMGGAIQITSVPGTGSTLRAAFIEEGGNGFQHATIPDRR